MKKKIIILTAVLMITMMSLTSCSGKIKSYTDKDGKTYDIVYDDNGNFITNDSNKLKVYILSDTGKKIKNENGEYRTDYIDFNGQIVNGRKVETKNFSFTLPAGFEQSYDTGLLFFRDSINAEIYISVLDNSDIDTEYSLVESNCIQLQESYGSDKFSYNIYDLKTKNDIPIHVFKTQCTSSDYPKTDYYYYFNINDKIYKITASVSTDSAKKADFDSFAKSFNFN